MRHFLRLTNKLRSFCHSQETVEQIKAAVILFVAAVGSRYLCVCFSTSGLSRLLQGLRVDGGGAGGARGGRGHDGRGWVGCSGGGKFKRGGGSVIVLQVIAGAVVVVEERVGQVRERARRRGRREPHESQVSEIDLKSLSEGTCEGHFNHLTFPNLQVRNHHQHRQGGRHQ